MKKIKWVVLPSLLVIGIGILEIQYPHTMDGFDDGYTGRGTTGLIMLIIELFFMITWGKIGGGIAILSGISALIISLFPNKKQAIESNPKENSPSVLLSSITVRYGKYLVQRKRTIKSK
jgi:hypothetical protein